MEITTAVAIGGLVLIGIGVLMWVAGGIIDIIIVAGATDGIAPAPNLIDVLLEIVQNLIAMLGQAWEIIFGNPAPPPSPSQSLSARGVLLILIGALVLLAGLLIPTG